MARVAKPIEHGRRIDAAEDHPLGVPVVVLGGIAAGIPNDVRRLPDCPCTLGRMDRQRQKHAAPAHRLTVIRHQLDPPSHTMGDPVADAHGVQFHPGKLLGKLLIRLPVKRQYHVDAAARERLTRQSRIDARLGDCRFQRGV